MALFSNNISGLINTVKQPDPTNPAPTPGMMYAGGNQNFNEAVGTAPISSGSVSNQLDTILGTPTGGAAGGGLLSSGATPSATSTTPPVTPPPPAQSTASTWNVNPNQTVEGRTAGLINSQALSPLMERAQARATEAANARGLQNTSMAVQAGEAALYDFAVPIAAADAKTYADSAQFNANNQQQNTQFNAEQMNKQNLVMLDGANKERLMQIEAGYKTLVTQNEGAAGLYDTYQKAINAILVNPDLSTVPDASGVSPKQFAINAQLGMMQTGMQMYSDIAGLNLTSIIGDGTADGLARAAQAAGGATMTPEPGAPPPPAPPQWKQNFSEQTEDYKDFENLKSPGSDLENVYHNVSDFFGW